MNVVRYDPFDIFEGVMKSVLRPAFESTLPFTEGRVNAIPMDIAEDDKSYHVWAELPGINKEDVTIAINGNQVTVSAEAKREYAVDQGQGSSTFLCNERRAGTLHRSIVLPAEIDEGKAEATYRNGVLELTLPKTAAAQVKRLAIH